MVVEALLGGRGVEGVESCLLDKEIGDVFGPEIEQLDQARLFDGLDLAADNLTVLPGSSR